MVARPLPEQLVDDLAAEEGLEEAVLGRTQLRLELIKQLPQELRGVHLMGHIDGFAIHRKRFAQSAGVNRPHLALLHLGKQELELSYEGFFGGSRGVGRIEDVVPKRGDMVELLQSRIHIAGR